MVLKCDLVRAEDFRSFFAKHASESQTIRIAVAYFRLGGYEQVKESLRRFLDSSKAHKCIGVVGMSGHYITQPEAIGKLLEDQTDFPNQLNLRYSSRRAFHLKMFLFEKMSATVALIGSSNLTGGGTRGNREANIAVEGDIGSDTVLADILRMFSEIAAEPVSAPLSKERLREYTWDYSKRSRSLRVAFRPTLRPTGEVGKSSSYPDIDEEEREESEALSTLQASRPARVVWKISPGERAFQWPEYLRRTDPKTNEGVIAIGWHEIGDPSLMSIERIAREARSRRWHKPKYVAEQLWTFFKQIRPGNLVVAYGKSSILDVGIVTGEPLHLLDEDPNVIYGNQCRVKWLKVGPVPLTRKERYEFCYPVDANHRISNRTISGRTALRIVRRAIAQKSLFQPVTPSTSP